MKEEDDMKSGISEQGKQNPFLIPEGYFGRFRERLQERIGSEGEVGRRKILRPAFFYIAGLCLLLIIGYSISRITLAPHALKIESDAPMASLIQYSLDNIDEHTIVEAITKSTQDSASSEISREEILKYLQDQNIDPVSYTHLTLPTKRIV